MKKENKLLTPDNFCFLLNVKKKIKNKKSAQILALIHKATAGIGPQAPSCREKSRPPHYSSTAGEPWVLITASLHSL